MLCGNYSKGNQMAKKNDDELFSDAARELSKRGASKGGKARAKKLTPEERSEIARRAVEARWKKQGKEPMPQATHSGTLTIGDIEFDCAVLEDQTRVISETNFMKSMGMYRSGALSTRRHGVGDGAPIPLFLAHKNLKPYADKHLGGVHFEPVKYRTSTGGVGHGIKAEMLPKICEVWLDAQKDGVLGKRQLITAAKAEIVVRGLATVGIIALVDEATGFQDTRARDALSKILEAFVAKELKKWISTFPADFYKEMFRLRGWPYAGTVKRPAYVGKLTNNLVYERLAPGVLDELRAKNPIAENGRRRHRHHQWLTEDIGHPKLLQHLASVVALMRASDTWDGFMALINRALPLQTKLPLFDSASDDTARKDDDEESSSRVPA